MSRPSHAAPAALTLLLTGSAISSLAAANWPQFRGPEGNGHSPARNVPLRWSATENIAWKAVVPGQGWSSPVLSGERLFLTAAIPGGGDTLALAALAFDASSGTLLWQTEIFSQGQDAPAIHRKNSHASPTPIVAGSRLFVHFGHMGTACLDLDGTVVWSTNAFPYPPVHGNGASPILVGNRLVFTADGGQDPHVVALDPATGQLAWRTPRPPIELRQKFSFATPTAILVRGRSQVVAPGSGLIAAYDPASGSELWRIQHGGYSVIPKPIYAHGLLYAGTGYNQPVALAIDPDGSGDITDSNLRWSLNRGAGHTPSFLLVGDELYLLADNGVLTCVDARSGTLHYQERATGPSSASPVFAEGRIYLLDESGLGVVVAPGRTFQKLAENPLDQRTLASYAVTDGALFIRSESHLFRIAAP